MKIELACGVTGGKYLGGYRSEGDAIKAIVKTPPFSNDDKGVPNV